MYICVHCKKEKCVCHNPYRRPDTPHDWPGQKRILRWNFPDFSEIKTPFSEFLSAMRVAFSGVMKVPESMFENKDDRTQWLPSIHWRRNRAIAEAKRDSYFHFQETGHDEPRPIKKEEDGDENYS